MENCLYSNRCGGNGKTVTFSITTKRQKQEPEASRCGHAVDFLNGYCPVISCLLQMKRYLLMMLIDKTINFCTILSETPDTDFLNVLSENYKPIIRLRQRFVFSWRRRSQKKVQTIETPLGPGLTFWLLSTFIIMAYSLYTGPRP